MKYTLKEHKMILKMYDVIVKHFPETTQEQTKVGMYEIFKFT